MPHKGRKSAGAKGPKEQCDKKTAGAAKPADKKTPDTAERKPGGASAGASTSAKATASGTSAGAAASSTKVPASQDRTMKPADTKPKTTTASSPSTTSTAKPSTGKTPIKQDAKAEPEKQKDSKVSPSVAGKAAAATVGAAAVSAAVVGTAAVGAAAAGAASSKPKEEVKKAEKAEDKKAASVDKTAAAAAPSKSEQDQALDSLIDTLGEPEEEPQSPEFTGPEITEAPIQSEYLEGLGKRETTLPPKYRHLLDGKGENPSVPEPKPADEGKGVKPSAPEPKPADKGKGEKPAIPPPQAAAEEGFGDDELLEALSSDLVSSPAPPEQKKPKLEEKKQAQVASSAAPSASSQPAPMALSEEALDELLGTLAAPPTNEPESPKFTGPVVTENITATHINYKPGDVDSTIPPEYRHLLDGKDHGRPIPPPTEHPEPPMSDNDLVDEFSKDFELSLSPAAETPNPLTPAAAKTPAPPPAAAKTPAPPPAAAKTLAPHPAAPAAAGKPKDTTKDKQATADVVVPSAASSVKAAAAPSTAASSASVDDALDALMDTLEGPEFSAPKSPQYTGPIITETRVATHVEGLGKRESTLPPKYRHLLDGKSDGKPAPPPPEEQPLSEADLLDELDFAGSQSPAAQTTPATKPQDAPVKTTTETEAVVSAVSASAVQASKAATSKAPPKADPLDALASTLGTRQEDPKDKKPVADKVKEKTGKEHRDKLGEDEETIPPEYRLKEVKDKDGKPLLPKPEEKPKSLSESDLLDELDKDFASPQSPAVKPAPATKPHDSTKKTTEPEAVVSAASASAVHAAPSKAATSKADPLDALAGTLGTRQEDPKDKKPVADKVKEKTGKEHRDKLGEDEETIPPEYRLKEVKDKDGKPLLPKPEEKPKELSEDDLLDALTEGFVTSPTVAQCAPLQSSAKVSGKSGSEEVVSCSKALSVQSGAAPQSPADSGAQIPDDALDLLSGSLGTRQEDPDDKKPIVDLVKEKVEEKHIEKLGDRDDTLPPEYRHLLDGKDQGQPAKPEELKPQKSLDENSAIDALSSGLASCDTGSTDKAKSCAKDKTEKSVSSAPAVTEKTADASKSTSQSSSTKPSAPPSAPKTGKS